MLRSFRRAILRIGLFATASLTFAANKYGVVDMQRVILSVEDGKKARSELQTEIKSREAELIKQKEELDKMNKQWKSQAALMSEEARFKKQREFQEKFLSLRNAEMELQADVRRKEQKATQKIFASVAAVVEGIAKTKKLEAVFERNTSGLLFLEGPVDLTDEVVAKYNEALPNKPSKKKSS